MNKEQEREEEDGGGGGKGDDEGKEDSDKDSQMEEDEQVSLAHGASLLEDKINSMTSSGAFAVQMQKMRRKTTQGRAGLKSKTMKARKAMARWETCEHMRSMIAGPIICNFGTIARSNRRPQVLSLQLFQ